MLRWTTEDLVRLGACDEQVALFRATFHDGATADDVARALAVGLDVEWMVRRVATAPALRAYEEARVKASRAYDEATAPAWRAYQEARVKALRAYQEATAPALAASLRSVERVTISEG